MIQKFHPLFCDATGPTVVYALHKWLIEIFLKTTEDSNPKVYTRVIPEDIYISTRNDVMGCFRSAKNHVDVTVAVTDFTVTK